MIPAKLPPNEEARLRALRDTGVLDTPPEQGFDDLTQLAVAAFNAPMALVSLVDRERQWFKSRIGVDDCETPRNVSFCAHAILEDDVLVVRDATADERFAQNPYVLSSPHVRFYAGAPIRLSTGERVGTVCVIDRAPRDITKDQYETLQRLARMAGTSLDLRRAGRELANANDRLGDYLDSVHDLIQSSSPDGKFLFVNRAWRAALGYTEDDLATMHVMDVVAPESREYVRGLREKLWSGEPLVNVEMVLLARDGQRILVEGNSTCKIEDGKPVWTRSIYRDVTAKKTAEREKHKFLMTTAREMRGPLTAALGALDAMSDEQLSAGGREVHGVAVTSAKRALDLLRDVVDLERLETGAYPIQQSPLSVDELIAHAMTKVKKVAADRHVAVRVDARPGIHVQGDRESIAQAFINLLSNAVRRSPPGREVTVRAAAADSVVHVSFGDEGDRIAPDERSHVFAAPSRRLEGSRTSEGAMALALSLAKAIVDAHGGTIGLANRVGAGETFWFELPMRAPR